MWHAMFAFVIPYLHKIKATLNFTRSFSAASVFLFFEIIGLNSNNDQQFQLFPVLETAIAKEAQKHHLTPPGKCRIRPYTPIFRIFMSRIKLTRDQQVTE